MPVTSKRKVSIVIFLLKNGVVNLLKTIPGQGGKKGRRSLRRVLATSASRGFSTISSGTYAKTKTLWMRNANSLISLVFYRYYF